MVESEPHVLLDFPLYEDLQLEMYSQAFAFNTAFYTLRENNDIYFHLKTATTCKGKTFFFFFI